jgi:catechol 2,3-dioxygenase-like lactoylglutathione lyase family enzyme
MLRDKDAVATIAVKELSVARKFYEGTLGLEVVEDAGTQALTFDSGRSRLVVYRSQYAGTNQATAVTWMVGEELAAIVHGLKERGVEFERYEMPGLTETGEIHAFGDLKTAWFKDPDGNIISLLNR